MLATVLFFFFNRPPPPVAAHMEKGPSVLLRMVAHMERGPKVLPRMVAHMGKGPKILPQMVAHLKPVCHRDCDVLLTLLSPCSFAVHCVHMVNGPNSYC